MKYKATVVTGHGERCQDFDTIQQAGEWVDTYNEDQLYSMIVEIPDPDETESGETK